MSLSSFQVVERIWNLFRLIYWSFYHSEFPQHLCTWFFYWDQLVEELKSLPKLSQMFPMPKQNKNKNKNENKNERVQLLSWPWWHIHLRIKSQVNFQCGLLPVINSGTGDLLATTTNVPGFRINMEWAHTHSFFSLSSELAILTQSGNADEQS